MAAKAAIKPGKVAKLATGRPLAAAAPAAGKRAKEEEENEYGRVYKKHRR